MVKMGRVPKIGVLTILIIVIVIGVSFFEIFQQPRPIEYKIIGDASHTYNSQAIDTDRDGLINYVVETDLWNVANCNGQVTMTVDVYKDGEFTLNVNIDLKNIQQENPSEWVHGYPEIWLGSNPWNTLGPANDTVIPFPIQLSKLNNTKIYVTIDEFSIYKHDPNLPYNLALETWLTKNASRGKPIQKGEVELMFWLTYNKITPAGSIIGDFEIPIWINGSATNATFELWKLSKGWEYFAFVPKMPMDHGKQVKFCWNTLVEIVKQYSSNKNWAQLYFMDVELGTEFGSPNYLNAELSWMVKNFNVTTTL